MGPWPDDKGSEWIRHREDRDGLRARKDTEMNDYSEGVKEIVKAATPNEAKQMPWAFAAVLTIDGVHHDIVERGVVTASEHSQAFATKFPMQDAMLVAAARCGATRAALLAVLAMGPAAVSAAAASVDPTIRDAILKARDAGVATTTTTVRRVRVTIK
jgi:hypothetical protein